MLWDRVRRGDGVKVCLKVGQNHWFPSIGQTWIVAVPVKVMAAMRLYASVTDMCMTPPEGRTTPSGTATVCAPMPILNQTVEDPAL